MIKVIFVFVGASQINSQSMCNDRVLGLLTANDHGLILRIKYIKIHIYKLIGDLVVILVILVKIWVILIELLEVHVLAAISFYF